MRYSPELAARAEAWLALPLVEKRSTEGLAELGSLWATIQSLPSVSCRQCQYSERAQDVAAYLREFNQFSHLSISAAMSDTTTPSKYQLAPAFAGQTFVHEDYGKAVTGDNLTDADAEFFRGVGRTDAFIERTASAAAADAGAPADADHAAELTKEQKAYGTTTAKLQKEQEAHGKTSDALKAEKEAHKTTKNELKEVSKQLADAQKQLAKLADQAGKAAGSAEADQTGADADKAGADDQAH